MICGVHCGAYACDLTGVEGVQDKGRERDERDMGEMMEFLQAQDTAGDADLVFTCGLTMEPFRDPVITPTATATSAPH